MRPYPYLSPDAERAAALAVLQQAAQEAADPAAAMAVLEDISTLVRRPPVRRFTPRRYQCSPDRAASRERRRTLGSQFPAPPQLRARFTQGEAAALTIIAGEVRTAGRCELPIDGIAAKAGVCRTTVQSAIHEARRLGLIHVQARAQLGRKNLTNIVTILSAEWIAWLKRSPAIGSKTMSRPKTVTKISNPTTRSVYNSARAERAEPPKRGIQERASKAA